MCRSKMEVAGWVQVRTCVHLSTWEAGAKKDVQNPPIRAKVNEKAKDGRNIYEENVTVLMLKMDKIINEINTSWQLLCRPQHPTYLTQLWTTELLAVHVAHTLLSPRYSSTSLSSGWCHDDWSELLLELCNSARYLRSRRGEKTYPKWWLCASWCIIS